MWWKGVESCSLVFLFVIIVLAELRFRALLLLFLKHNTIHSATSRLPRCCVLTIRSHRDTVRSCYLCFEAVNISKSACTIYCCCAGGKTFKTERTARGKYENIYVVKKHRDGSWNSMECVKNINDNHKWIFLLFVNDIYKKYLWLSTSTVWIPFLVLFEALNLNFRMFRRNKKVFPLIDSKIPRKLMLTSSGVLELETKWFIRSFISSRLNNKTLFIQWNFCKLISNLRFSKELRFNLWLLQRSNKL